MGNISEIKKLKDDNVIEALEELLAEAKAGNLTSIAYAGEIGHEYIRGHAGAVSVAIIGEIEIEKAHIIKNIFGV